MELKCVKIDTEECFTPEGAAAELAQKEEREARRNKHFEEEYGYAPESHILSRKVVGSKIMTLKWATTDPSEVEYLYFEERAAPNFADMLTGRARLPGQEESTNETPSGMLDGLEI